MRPIVLVVSWMLATFILIVTVVVGTAALWHVSLPASLSHQVDAEASVELQLDPHNVRPHDARLRDFPGEYQSVIEYPPVAHKIAKETIRRLRLDMSPSTLLDSLSVEEGSSSEAGKVIITYRGDTRAEANRIAHTVAEVSTEFTPNGGGFTAKVN